MRSRFRPTVIEIVAWGFRQLLHSPSINHPAISQTLDDVPNNFHCHHNEYKKLQGASSIEENPRYQATTIHGFDDRLRNQEVGTKLEHSIDLPPKAIYKSAVPNIYTLFDCDEFL
jgi:hypothetical protein